jgi:uncharacterized cupin superfamily protein
LEKTMTHIVYRDELPSNGSVYKFEGHLYGDANVSFFLSDTAPGKGPDLHKRPYEEVFVVQEGELTFTVGDETIDARGGQLDGTSANGLGEIGAHSSRIGEPGGRTLDRREAFLEREHSTAALAAAAL